MKGNALLWNVLLALIWTLATGEFTLQSYAAGFLVGFLILLISQRVVGSQSYTRRIWNAIRFSLFFLWELFISNLRVAYDIVTPRHHMQPGVIAVPLDAETDVEITLLSNLITLTPGTLGLDVSTDRTVLYVHLVYMGDADEAKRKIKEGYERKVLEVLR
jgi:multicomponent Na+:H+ antiporter subunit E